MNEDRLAQIEAELCEDVSWRDQADRSALAWELLAALKQVRAGLAGLHRPHGRNCQSHTRGLETVCTCGAWSTKIINAKVDALLKGDT